MEINNKTYFESFEDNLYNYSGISDMATAFSLISKNSKEDNYSLSKKHLYKGIAKLVVSLGSMVALTYFASRCKNYFLSNKSLEIKEIKCETAYKDCRVYWEAVVGYLSNTNNLSIEDLSYKEQVIASLEGDGCLAEKEVCLSK